MNNQTVTLLPPPSAPLSTPQCSVAAPLPTQFTLKYVTNTILNTLQLLGFDFVSIEKQHKLVYNASTFLKPNAKAFELILHFLLSQLDPERAQRAFAQCWPPLLREQQKDFKDVIFNWLTEISVTTKPQQQQQQQLKTAGLPSPSYNLLQFSNFHQSLVREIKFPTISKSLLMSPGGSKTCELLLAVCQYVQLIRSIRIIESESSSSSESKLFKRIVPKFSPITLTSLEMNQVLNEQSQNKPNQTSKLTNQKQLNQMDTYLYSLKRKILGELNEFIDFVDEQIITRNKWQEYSSERINRIKVNLQKKLEYANNIKKRFAQVNESKSTDQFSTDDPAILEELYANLVEKRLDKVNKRCDDVQKLAEEVFGSSKDGEESALDFVLTGKSNNYKIDGDELNKILRSDTNEKILKYIFQNIDQNATIRNTKVGSLYNETDNKLDVINLTRFFNLVLLLVGDIYTKIDPEKLNKLSINYSSAPNQDFKKTEKFSIDDLNRQAFELKQKLDAFLPKLAEKNALSEKKFTSSINLEQLSTKLKSDGSSDSELVDLANEALDLFDKYFEYSKKGSIDMDKINQLVSEKESSAGEKKDGNKLDDFLNEFDLNNKNKKSERGDESLANSSVSSESFTSTKIFSNKDKLAMKPIYLLPNDEAKASSHHHHHHQIVSPIMNKASNHNHEIINEEQYNKSPASSDVSEEVHSSLQIIDFDDENMDLI